MDKTVLQTVDVVIPVYNAPVLTKRCIDSVVAVLGQLIRYIHIQNDASDAETRKMLESLLYPCVRIYHAKKNQGFGRSVNDAIGHSAAEFVLVLNTDTEVNEDVLTPLCSAMNADPQLAVISPGHKIYSKNEVNRFLRRPGGYVPSYRLQGHAFLIRRAVFQELGGFDPVFGKGYFEDIDLGRRLYQSGWRMGVHPDICVFHKGGGSFGRGLMYQKLVKINRALYLSRYPNAKRNVLFLSGSHLLGQLPVNLVREIEKIFREGGNVHWLTPKPAPQLLCFHMRNSPSNLWTVLKIIMGGLKRQDKRISEVWLFSGTTDFLQRLFSIYARLLKLQVRSWTVY